MANGEGIECCNMSSSCRRARRRRRRRQWRKVLAAEMLEDSALTALTFNLSKIVPIPLCTSTGSLRRKNDTVYSKRSYLFLRW